MKEIELLDVLTVCSNFLSNPEIKENQEKLEDLKQNLIIKKILPLHQKEIVVMKTIFDVNTIDEDSSSAALALEVSLLFNALLSYTNITNNAQIAYISNQAYYDILIMSGLVDYVMEFCGEDYKRVEKLVDRMISFENIKSLVNLLSKMDTASLEGLTDEFKKFTLETNPESLRYLADIMRHNDPVYTAVKDNIINSAVDEAMKKR